MGLTNYEGLKSGKFKAVNSDKIYDYKLHLNYDDQAWRIFRGNDLNESNYERISKFKILRINYLVGEECYSVEVKMDAMEGKTLNIFSSDLIMDTDTVGFKVKDAIYDFVGDVKDKIDNNKKTFWIITGSILIVLVVSFVIKIPKKI
jgi:hypothetical protein